MRACSASNGRLPLKSVSFHAFFDRNPRQKIGAISIDLQVGGLINGSIQVGGHCKGRRAVDFHWLLIDYTGKCCILTSSFSHGTDDDGRNGHDNAAECGHIGEHLSPAGRFAWEDSLEIRLWFPEASFRIHQIKFGEAKLIVHSGKYLPLSTTIVKCDYID